MRKSLAVLAVSLLIAAPAHATGGLLCRTGGSHPIEVGLVIGHTVASSIVSARLRDGGAEVPVHIAHSWLDANELRLDLVDSNAIRHELRLRAKRKRLTYDGSVWRGSNRRWI